ncbi:MAG: sulfate transporter family protein [Methylobacteriaceae bacterium]|nr:sulfate transporter family protein [Methylobacteriaceae bacterium]
MLDDALAAFRQIFTPPFRAVLFKTLALTLLLLGLVWFGLDQLVLHFINVQTAWVATLLSIVTGVGLFIGLAFLLAPTSSLVAGLFLDELAAIVERDIYPSDRIGRALPAGYAVWLAMRFALLSAIVNLIALVLLLVPGINAIAFFVANAYLLSREFFELAALRYSPLEEVRALRRRHPMRIFVAGLLIAALLAVPILNLLTPLFGVAFMVRLHKRIAPPMALPLKT